MSHIKTIPITSREEWLAGRPKYIGASEVPAVAGADMFGSSARIYAQKRGLIPAQEQTEAMKKGLWGEAAAFEALSWEHPQLEARRVKIVLLDEPARLGATPDGVAVDPDRGGVVIIEAKVTSRSVAKRYMSNPGDDPHDPFAPMEAPLGYQLQALTTAMLADATKAIIAMLITDEWKWSLRLFDVLRNSAAEQKIRELVARFWREHLDPGVPPPVDPERDGELVKLLWPADDGSTIDLSGDNELPIIVDRLEELKAAIKQSSDEKTAIETGLKARIGSHTCATIADGRYLSWKQQTRAEHIVPESTFRVLRVGKQKGKHVR